MFGEIFIEKFTIRNTENILYRRYFVVIFIRQKFWDLTSPSTRTGTFVASRFRVRPALATSCNEHAHFVLKTQPSKLFKIKFRLTGFFLTSSNSWGYASSPLNHSASVHSFKTSPNVLWSNLKKKLDKLRSKTPICRKQGWPKAKILKTQRQFQFLRASKSKSKKWSPKTLNDKDKDLSSLGAKSAGYLNANSRW